MALEIRQSLKLTQSLIMTQKLQQAIKLLQLSRLELEGEIQQVLETNPVLEDAELQFEEKPVVEEQLGVPEFSGDGEPAQEAAPADNGEAKSSVEEWDWDSFLNDRLMPPPMGEYEEREAFPFESLNAEKTTLKSHLTWQLQMAELDEDSEAIGTLIIGNLDMDGYLRATTEEIAAEMGVEPARVEEVLAVVQGFDPPGVAARTLQECLQIQIKLLPTPDPLVTGDHQRPPDQSGQQELSGHRPGPEGHHGQSDPGQRNHHAVGAQTRPGLRQRRYGLHQPRRPRGEGGQRLRHPVE